MSENEINDDKAVNNPRSSPASLEFDRRLPSSEDLRKRAKSRMPKFAYEYLVEGCMDDIGLERNRRAIQSITLEPRYLQKYDTADLSVEIFGHRYDAPFGVAPIGLQGLMWPNAPVILAKAAKAHNVPFILSTVSSESMEIIAEVTEGEAWYQLYNPTRENIRKDILKRAKAAGYRNLVILVDVPTFGYRPRDFRNGLSMPPKKNIRNYIQAGLRPQWSLKTLKYGVPTFKNLKPYMEQGVDMKELTEFMNTMVMGDIDFESLKPIRDAWDGKIIVKGIMCDSDMQLAIELGADGVIISNHGARQLDACDASVTVTHALASKYGKQLTVMMDSGLRSGTDLACALASGAKFGFFGRFFMYAVAAMGDEGGQQAMAILKTQLAQTMNQIRCTSVSELPDFLSSMKADG